MTPSTSRELPDIEGTKRLKKKGKKKKRPKKASGGAEVMCYIL